MNKLSKFLVVAIAISAFLVAFSQREIVRNLSGRFLTYPNITTTFRVTTTF